YPHRAGEIGEDEMMLHPAVEVQVQVFRATSVGQFGDVLAGDGMQPGQPLGAGDGEDETVRPVHDRQPFVRGALFAEWVAVMPGDRSIQGAGHSGYRSR